MPLPLKPPVKPQLALSRKVLPEGEDWVYERAKSGELPSFKLPGGLRRFRLSEVDRALEERYREGGSVPRLRTA